MKREQSDRNTEPNVAKRRLAVFQGERYAAAPAAAAALHAVGLGPGDNWANSKHGTRVPGKGRGPRARHAVLNAGEDSRALAIFYKSETYPLKDRLKFWMRPSRAGVETFAYRALANMDVATLEVVAFGEKRWLGMPLQTVIVTLEAEDTVNLRDFAADEWRRLPAAQQRAALKEISDSLALQLRRAHARQFVHHDLKWRNVLVQKSSAGYKTVWIDAPRAALWRVRRRRGRVVDLSDLAGSAVPLMSKYDRMRFVMRYLGPTRKAGDAAALCRAIEQRLSRRRKR